MQQVPERIPHAHTGTVLTPSQGRCFIQYASQKSVYIVNVMKENNHHTREGKNTGELLFLIQNELIMICAKTFRRKRFISPKNKRQIKTQQLICEGWYSITISEVLSAYSLPPNLLDKILSV